MSAASTAACSASTSPAAAIPDNVNTHLSPVSCSDGTNYLLVWRDHRQNEDRDTGDIWGARVTPDGRPD